MLLKYNHLKQYQQLQHIQAQQEQAAAGGLTLTLHHQTTVIILKIHNNF